MRTLWKPANEIVHLFCSLDSTQENLWSLLSSGLKAEKNQEKSQKLHFIPSTLSCIQILGVFYAHLLTHHELDFSDIGVKKQKKYTSKRKKKESTVSSNDDSITQQLLDLKALLDQGIITKDEFIKAKKKILN